MKLLIVTLLLCSYAHATKIKVKLDLEGSEKTRSFALKQELLIGTGTITSLPLPKTNKLVELKVDTNKDSEDLVNISLDVYRVKGESKELISSPRIITKYGQDAMMETKSEDDTGNELSSLKLIVTPEKI